MTVQGQRVFGLAAEFRRPACKMHVRGGWGIERRRQGTFDSIVPTAMETLPRPNSLFPAWRRQNFRSRFSSSILIPRNMAHPGRIHLTRLLRNRSSIFSRLVLPDSPPSPRLRSNEKFETFLKILDARRVREREREASRPSLIHRSLSSFQSFTSSSPFRTHSHRTPFVRSDEVGRKNGEKRERANRREKKPQTGRIKKAKATEQIARITQAVAS